MNKEKYIGSTITYNSLARRIYSIFMSETRSMIPKYILEYIYYKIKSPKKFVYEGKTYKCFYHWYNTTWRGGRELEIPIILRYLKSYRGEVLEVGNVLSHYFKISHDVLDKYEKSLGVINKDAVTFKSKNKYDLIISISTIEHIGWDETPRDPKKITKAIENLMYNLKENGTLIFTVPVGYNSYLDELILKDKMKIHKKTFMRREKRKWKEININELKRLEHNQKSGKEETICIGIIKK